MKGAIAGGGEWSQVEGSYHWWRGRSQVEGSGLRWRGAIAGGGERSRACVRDCMRVPLWPLPLFPCLPRLSFLSSSSLPCLSHSIILIPSLTPSLPPSLSPSLSTASPSFLSPSPRPARSGRCAAPPPPATPPPPCVCGATEGAARRQAQRATRTGEGPEPRRQTYGGGGAGCPRGGEGPRGRRGAA